MVIINDLDKLKKAFVEHDLCVVKIGTSWCGPCKVLEKYIEDVEVLQPDVYFINVDAEECDERILEDYGVRGVPVTIVIKNGEVTSKHVGLQTQKELETRL